MSSPNFQLIRDALDDYTESMKINLRDNAFAEEAKACDSPGAVLQLLEKSRDEFKEFRDKNRKFIDSLKPVVQFVHSFSGILSEAAGLVPFPPAKLIIVGINGLFSAAEGVSASYDALLELFECIGSFLKRLEIYTNIPSTPLMTEIIVKIMVELLSILAQAKKQIKQGRFKQFAKKFLGDSEIESILRRLDRLTQDEARMMEAQILEVVHGLMNNMKVVMDGGEASTREIRKTLVTIQDVIIEMNKMNRDRLHEKSRSWLSPPDPSENQVIARRDHHDGSAVWFIRGGTFKDWNVTGCLLWIHGKPGSGKSILCSTIIEEAMALRDAGLALTAYYYFDFRNTAKRDIRGLLTSLLVQLCAKSDSCYQVFLRLYFDHDDGLRLPDDKALVKCLRDILELREQPVIYLIIDALDECPGTSGVVSPRDRVLELIKNLVEPHLSNLRVCVTSRPEADIQDALHSLASHTVSLHEEDGHKQDMVDYVTSVVQSDQKMRKWSAKDKKLVIDTISEKADGMFRWVFCQLEALRPRIPGTIARALKELPQTLDETYERILLGINDDIQKYACCLFQCLSASIRPLRVAEIADILDDLFDAGDDSDDYIDWQSEGAQQALLSACSSLIVVVNVDGSPVVQFAHFTVREFLMSNRLANAGERLSRYHVLPHSAHTILARAALGVLLSFDDRVQSNEEAVEDRPFAVYAARFWIDHAKLGGESPNVQSLMGRLFDRNEPYFATWVRIHDFDHSPEAPMTITPRRASPLYYAALCGLPRVAEHLAVSCPMDVNARGGHYVTPLYAALTNREFDVARTLLRHAADINAPGMNGFSPLHSASLDGDRDVVQLLLEHRADINVRKYVREGRYKLAFTPLYFSALAGQLEICRLLLKHGAEVDARKLLAESPLQAATRGGHARVLKLLLDNGLPDFPDRKHQTALITATRRGDLDIVRILIENDTDEASRNSKISLALDLASEDGYLDIVQYLLINGADPNTRGGSQCALHQASGAGHLGIVKLLVQHGSALDFVNYRQETALNLAFRCEKLEVARFLIEAGANLMSKDSQGLSTLHHASRGGYLDLMEVLTKGGVDVNVRNANGETPLHLASADRNLDAAAFLIERGADVNAQCAERSSPLHRASARGHLDVVEFLIERGANINMENNNGEIPLHCASDKGKLAVVRFLIKCGSDLGSKDRDGRTPLHAAARGGCLDVVELLLESGADIEVRDRRGKSLFNVAPRFWEDEVASNLIKRFAPPDSEWRLIQVDEDSGDEGDTPNNEDEASLLASSAAGHLAVVRSLLDRGVDVNTRNANGNTSLHVASERGRLEVVRLLINRGPDVNCRDKQGHTPLDLSSQSGFLDVARLLLDHGADANTTCQIGFTPLHNASSQGHVEIVQLLIERGANVNARGRYGFTPLRGAQFNKKNEVGQLLIEHGAN